jgi:hypothetical protein
LCDQPVKGRVYVVRDIWLGVALDARMAEKFFGVIARSEGEALKVERAAAFVAADSSGEYGV